ncbi:MAG: hypothetical protein MK085_04495 [Phycisphaerales bacterium]|nr:hypothetical protein [Phycisphaerales bacterium]
MPLGGGDSSGFGMLGMFIMPASIVMLILKQPAGAVSKLIKAGATSERTARKLETVEITRVYLVENAIRRKIVHRTGDGRYWVDVARNRRRRRNMALAGGCLALLLCVGVWFAWPYITAPLNTEMP